MCKKDFENMSRAEVEKTVREVFVLLSKKHNPRLSKETDEWVCEHLGGKSNVPRMLNIISNMMFLNRSSGFLTGVDTRVFDKIDICAHAVNSLDTTGIYFNQTGDEL